QGRSADHVPARILDRLDALAGGQARRDDVLDHRNLRSRPDREGPAELEGPALALDVDRGDAQVTGGLVAGNNAADGRRDADVDFSHALPDLRRQRLAEA